MNHTSHWYRKLQEVILFALDTRAPVYNPNQFESELLGGKITIEYSRLDVLRFYSLTKYCFVSDKFKCRRKTDVCKAITAKTYW